MYRTVLLPLDGSQFSEQALPLASALADRWGAQLKVVHVYEPQAEPDWDEITPFRYEGVERAEREWNGEAVRFEQEYLSAHVAADCKVIEGKVVECLETEIAESAPDLIVMATHGRGGISRAWLGSVADNLIRHIHKPILLVRASEQEAQNFELCTDHLLVTLDGSPLAEAVLKHALAIAQPSRTRITLLRVVPPAYVATELNGLVQSDSHLRERVQAAHDYLNGVATQLGVEGYLVDSDVVVSVHAATTILTYADEHQCDIICMATHGRSGVQRLLLGSVADKVLRGADRPVLVYRP
jgi:nucleotide-binding universal stress UspA family protein